MLRRRPVARRRAMRRRRGRRLVAAAAVGGTAYYAGKKVSEGRQAEEMQDEQIAELQDQVDSQQAAAPAPPPPAQAPAQPPPAAAPGAGSDTVARLQELANLHASGVLNDDEFAAAKQKVLAGE